MLACAGFMVVLPVSSMSLIAVSTPGEQRNAVVTCLLLLALLGGLWLVCSAIGCTSLGVSILRWGAYESIGNRCDNAVQHEGVSDLRSDLTDLTMLDIAAAHGCHMYRGAMAPVSGPSNLNEAVVSVTLSTVLLASTMLADPPPLQTRYAAACCMLPARCKRTGRLVKSAPQQVCA
jgi:hypothetical protein